MTLVEFNCFYGTYFIIKPGGSSYIYAYKD